MRIQSLAQQSGITKRNIHFYIKERLLQPKVDPISGYYDFSEEDLNRLILVKILREADFSISVIRSMLQTPASAEYYFRMRLGRIQNEIEHSKCIERKLRNVLEKISINPKDTEFSSLVLQEMKMSDRETTIYDGYLVNHFLWRIYWPEGEMSEYQQFLWDKINRMTDIREKNPDYAKVYDYLCLQAPDKIAMLYAERHNHYNYVAELSQEGILLYVEEMKKNLKQFVKSPNMIRQWKNLMKSMYDPMIRIYTSEIGKLAEEMCPFFQKYKSKSQHACKITYEWLYTEEGNELLEELMQVLNKELDLERCEHAELESISMMFKY